MHIVRLRDNMKSKLIIWLFYFAALNLASCSKDDGSGPSNHPPIIHAIPDTSASIGDTLKLIATAEDEDGDSLFFGSISLYNSLMELRLDYQADHNIDRITGAFWFLPTSSDLPIRRFLVCVNDGMGGADTTFFAVDVHY